MWRHEQARRPSSRIVRLGGSLGDESPLGVPFRDEQGGNLDVSESRPSRHHILPGQPSRASARSSCSSIWSFVFTITQLTSLLARDPSITGLLETMLIFGNVWWMYGGLRLADQRGSPRESASACCCWWG